MPVKAYDVAPEGLDKGTGMRSVISSPYGIILLKFGHKNIGLLTSVPRRN
jgi:hypothetical protein